MTTSPDVGLQPQDFDALDDILDDLRTRYDETPQWEFCEGFLAAMVCCRTPLAQDDWLNVLLGMDEGGSFANEAQRDRFLALWSQRFGEVKAALDADIEALDDDRAYAPEVMDIRGAIASLPPEERTDIEGDEIPSFAQVWALGFMFAVENWPDEWVAPKDKDAAKLHDHCLEAVVALTEDDTDEPTVVVFDDDSPPSVSEPRMQALADAIWAVYGLRELWRNVGPRVATIRAEVTPGRNDPCFCGSGKKYKKCHGA